MHLYHALRFLFTFAISSDTSDLMSAVNNIFTSLLQRTLALPRTENRESALLLWLDVADVCLQLSRTCECLITETFCQLRPERSTAAMSSAFSQSIRSVHSSGSRALVSLTFEMQMRDWWYRLMEADIALLSFSLAFYIAMLAIRLRTGNLWFFKLSETGYGSKLFC